MAQHLMRKRAMPVLANVHDQFRSTRRPVVVAMAADNLAEVPEQGRTHRISIKVFALDRASGDHFGEHQRDPRVGLVGVGQSLDAPRQAFGRAMERLDALRERGWAEDEIRPVRMLPNPHGGDSSPESPQKESNSDLIIQRNPITRCTTPSPLRPGQAYGLIAPAQVVRQTA